MQRYAYFCPNICTNLLGCGVSVLCLGNSVANLGDFCPRLSPSNDRKPLISASLSLDMCRMFEEIFGPSKRFPVGGC